MTRGNPDAFDRNQSNSYRHYHTDSQYTYDPGVMVLPVANATPTTVKVRYHGGHGTRTVEFDAMKNRNPPIIPAPQDTTRDVLIGASVNLPIPIPDATNNGYVWRASGKYTYVTNNTPRIPGEDFLPLVQHPYPVPQDEVALGMLGDQSVESLQNQIQASDFERGTYLWPLTIMPKIFFNPAMVY